MTLPMDIRLASEAAKFGFVLYVAKVPTYERVYGTLAALPLYSRPVV